MENEANPPVEQINGDPNNEQPPPQHQHVNTEPEALLSSAENPPAEVNQEQAPPAENPPAEVNQEQAPPAENPPAEVNQVLTPPQEPEKQ